MNAPSTTAPRDATSSRDLVRVTIASVEPSGDGGRVIVLIPGTEYRLWLRPEAPGAFSGPGSLPSALRDRIGRRVEGRISAAALRMHLASAGGRFIEPLDGMPRIVQGAILDVDTLTRRVLVDVGVPMWVTLHPDQAITAFAPGELWNCYLESGSTFVASITPRDPGEATPASMGAEPPDGRL